MSLGEQMYLGMVLFAFIGFMAILAGLAWSDSRLDRARKPAARPAIRLGGASHAGH
jgi:hypothetical protein